MPRLRVFLPAVLSFLLASGASAQAGPGKPLDHGVYGYWNRISGQALSHDGAWALYEVEADSVDATLHIAGLNGGTAQHIARGDNGEFTADARFAIFLLKPAKQAVRQARLDKKKPEELPTDSLGILDLGSGMITRIARVKSFKLPRRSGAYLAYQLVKPEAKPDSAGPDSARAAPGAQPPKPAAEPGRQPEPAPGTAAAPAAQAKKKDEPKREEGTELVLRTLATGEERRIADVVWYGFTEDGTRLVYTAGNKAGTAEGAFELATRRGAQTPTLLLGKGNYLTPGVDKAGRQVAFLANTADFTAERPEFTLYYWDGRAAAAAPVADARTPGVPEGWWVSENGSVSFSESGARLFFGTAPKPAPPPADTALSDEQVKVDVWHWQDPLIQPMQLSQLEQEKKRTYLAAYDFQGRRAVQLATRDIPDIEVANRGDGTIALGASGLPYQIATQWGEDGTDFYLVDVATGRATRVIEYLSGRAQLSPEGRWLTWYDRQQRQWLALDTRTRQQRVVSAGLPPVFDEQHDTPDLPTAYGSAGWTLNDDLFLIYDRHDLWAVDPTGRRAPANVTDGEGRKQNLRFRYVRLDPEERAIDPSRDLLLRAFQLWTKQAGFYRDRMAAGAAPVQLLMAEKSFGQPTRARDADVLLVTRGDFREFPDLWVTEPSFRKFTRLSDANPQQQQYSWGTAELVTWRSGDGELLQGVLYKPDGFDPAKRYPMMVYFYERMSDGLYSHVVPAAGSSSINTTFYVSRGYLVFNPDIPYRTGYPGESALKAVIPGVLELIDQGFVDERHIGVQGHSWGGYQIAYLVTKTDIFAAAEAGAPVANMTSAYGGIRWESGMSRQFQYEKTQSRIGGTLWNAPLHFIENSPIFWADKVQTPLLMMHNDADGAVPWQQGIEYFLALRRLSKPVWMLNYNGEAHGLRKPQNRYDWTVRLQQFFDHYLLGAPAPVWLSRGVPALQKGKTLGLELAATTPPERPVSR
ncbi:MAG: S9 family peptidase [Gemmatimonadetes bacterium]|nr:S9 family peptidase [Gemmatimonadota bacterium]